MESEIKYKLNLTKARIYVTIFWHENGIKSKELVKKILSEYPVSNKTIYKSLKELTKDKLITQIKQHRNIHNSMTAITKYVANKAHPHYKITENYYAQKNKVGVYNNVELRTSTNCIWIYDMLLRAIKKVQESKYTKNNRIKEEDRTELETIIKDLGKILFLYKKYDAFNLLPRSNTIRQVASDLENLLLAHNDKIISRSTKPQR